MSVMGASRKCIECRVVAELLTECCELDRADPSTQNKGAVGVRAARYGGVCVTRDPLFLRRPKPNRNPPSTLASLPASLEVSRS